MTTGIEVRALTAENARLRAVLANVLKIEPYCLTTSGVITVRLTDLHSALGMCTSLDGGSLAVCELDADHGGDLHVGGGMSWTEGSKVAEPWRWPGRPLEAWAAQRACCSACEEQLVRDPELIGAWASAAGGPLRGVCMADGRPPGSMHVAVQEGPSF